MSKTEAEMHKARQKVFNIIYRHFVLNKQKLAIHKGKCRYRTPDGDKCVIGLLIPDSLYSTRLEGLSIEFDEIWFTIPRAYRPAGLDFLQALQRIHDRTYYFQETFTAEITKELNDFAITWELSIPRKTKSGTPRYRYFLSTIRKQVYRVGRKPEDLACYYHPDDKELKKPITSMYMNKEVLSELGTKLLSRGRLEQH